MTNINICLISKFEGISELMNLGFSLVLITYSYSKSQIDQVAFLLVHLTDLKKLVSFWFFR